MEAVDAYGNHTENTLLWHASCLNQYAQRGWLIQSGPDVFGMVAEPILHAGDERQVENG
jgi:hypothetical protein